MNLSTYDLNHLRALHALLDESHVSRAARRLGVTPAAASNALRRLREEFGDPLLVRSGRSLVRTPLGERLRGPVRAVMEAAEAVLAVNRDFDPSTYDGEIVLTTFDYIGSVLLGPLERVLSAGAPRASLRWRPFPREMMHWLRERGDVLLAPAFDCDLESAPLFDDPFVCAMGPEHPLARGEMTLHDYAAASHVLVAPMGHSDRSFVDQRLAERGLERRVTRTIATFNPIGELLLAGPHIATVSASLGRRLAARDGVVIRPLPLPVRDHTIHLYWHRRHADDPRHRWIRGLIQRAVADPAAGLRPSAPAA